MNCQLLILRAIYDKHNISQRDLAKEYFISLGKVNQTLKELTDNNLLEGSIHYQLTKKGEESLFDNKVDCAVILATDVGIKLNPTDESLSKAFLEINNEKLVERQIAQLKKVGIQDIYIIIGYQKEKYDYLIDKYNVTLIYDYEYNKKSTLSALYKVSDYIKGKNCYIIPSHIYMKKNEFHSYEFEAYYCAKYVDGITKKRYPDTTVQNAIISIMLGGKDSFCMCGFAYFNKEFSDKIMYLIKRYYDMPQTDSFTWEEILMRNLDILPPIFIYKKDKDDIVEFDTIDDLRKYDYKYYGKGSFPYDFVIEELKISKEDITNITINKIGITYNYWMFNIDNEEYAGKRFLLRIPNNEEIDIDYQNEDVYYKNNKEDNNILLFDEKTGIKVSIFNDNIKQIDKKDLNNKKEIINYYKNFHNLDVTYRLNNISIISLFEKYEKIIKSKNIKMKYIDFDIYFEKCKTILSRLKEYKAERKLINLHLYDDNIYINENGDIKNIEYDCVGLGDAIDDIANYCTKQNLNIKESEEVLEDYIKLDKNIVKELNEKDIKQIFLYKLSLMAMLNVLYISYKEVVTMFDTEDFQMKQYRLFKNIISYLESNQ